MSWVFHNEVLAELRTNQPLSSPVLIVSNSSEKKGKEQGKFHSCSCLRGAGPLGYVWR